MWKGFGLAVALGLGFTPSYAAADPFEQGYPAPDPQGANLNAMPAYKRLQWIDLSEQMLATTANTIFTGGTPTVDITQATVQAQVGNSVLICGRAVFWFPDDDEPMPLATFIIHTEHGVAKIGRAHV